VESYLAQRAAHIASAVPGVEAARALSEMTDEAVRELSRAASSRITERWAVLALGGWGCGAMLPASDLDILVLSDAPAERLKPFVEALLYPLWDAGLKVGHQVRSPKQQVKAMREDLKTCTAMLTARPIAGDVHWAEQTVRACVAAVAKRPRRLLGELDARPRPGSPYGLEPDLKEGAGGRRDYDELTWRAALLAGAPQHDPSALLRAGVLTRSELDELRTAAAAVTQARWQLQRQGFGDSMSIESLDGLGSNDAEEVQAALGQTALLLSRTRARIAGESDGSGEPLTPEEVFALLGRGQAAVEPLERAAQAGRLDALLPGCRRLMSVRRPGLGHELTVGAHCLRSAALVAEVRADGALGRSKAAAGDLRPVQVAALVHDVGKVDGGAGHAERGAPSAARAARAFGLSEAAATDVAELVRLHLLLVETALRVDLDDEDAILRCAAAIGRAELLAPLHLLTAVDSLATGPSTWTPWTDAMVSTLVARLDAALSPAVDGAGLVARAEQVRSATLGALSGDAGAHVEFVRSANLRYLASREPGQIARDARLVAELTASSAADAALVAVSPGPADGTHAVTVAAPDRPELLARLAGATALAGLDILSVEAYPAPGGVALDVFVVASATKRPVSTDTFASFERLARAALRDRLELATRLAERRRHYPARSQVPVKVETMPSGWDTSIRVTAPDRPGLLHDVAHAVSQEGVDIRWAKVQTVDGVARDTFHVVGPDGGPVDDAGVLGHIAMRIRAAV